MAADKGNEHRVLALTPNSRDARATCEILGKAGIASTICADMADVCRKIDSGAGAVLLTSDSLVLEGAVATLATALNSQPKWSDLPVVVLASGGANSAIALGALEALPNVLVLDRPVHLPTLVSAVKTALRSRERQYELRDHLEELKRTEEALRASERRLRTFFESDIIGTLYWDTDGRISDANDRFLKIVGYSREELTSGQVSWAQMTPPEYRYLDDRALAELLATGVDTPYEKEFIRKDGTRVPIFIGAAMLDESRYEGVAYVLDITDRKRAEQSLRQSEEKYRQLFESMSEGFLLVEAVLDDSGKPIGYRYLDANPALERITGLKPQEIIGRDIREILPVIEPRLVDAFGRVALTGEPLHLEQFSRALDNWYEGYVYSPERGKAAAIFSNVTERKRAEEGLRASEQRLVLAQEAGCVGVFDWDVVTGDVVWTSQLEKVYGMAMPEEPKERQGTWLRHVHPDDRTALLEGARRWLDSDRNEQQWEYRFIRPDGEERWILGRSLVCRDSQNRPLRVVGTNIDITERKRAEQALRESAERMQMALEVSRSFAFEWDVATDRVVRSESCGPIMGLSGEDARSDIAQEYFQRVDAADRDSFLHTLKELNPSADTYQTTYRLRRSDGATVVLEEFGRAFFDGDGQLTRLVGVSTDITARHQAEEALRESEAQFRAFFQNAAVGAALLGLDKRLLEVNDRYCRITGFSRDELLRMTTDDLTHPEDRPEANERMAGYLAGVAGQGGEYHAEKRYIRKDGEVVWVEVTAALVRDAEGRPVRSAGIIQDITERRRIEQTLKEDERRKDEFLAMLGHELRNPLAAITAGLRLLRSPNAERHEWVIGSLEHQTRQLVALVDDLLDISRITRGKIQLRPEIVDLRTVAQNAAESVSALIVEKKHSFSISCPELPLAVLGDPTRLQQIIANLVNNAAKYTPDEGRIELTLSQLGDEAVIAVKDNGMGIPADMQESIFELFGQVDSPTHRPQQGLGIGLSLVKTLAVLHGGSVAVASEGEGKGSLFTVRLPAVEWPDELECPDGRKAGAGEDPLDILLVEDNHQSAEMLKAVLEERSHSVRVAESGREAIRLALASQPDLVILDIGLPDISGYEVAQALRQELGYADTLIIAATGYGQERDRQQSRQAGIDHHLVKPIEYETVALLAREWRRTARQRGRGPQRHPAAERQGTGREGARILVIDDVRAIAQMTQEMLEEEGHQVETAFDGCSGLEAARRFRPDLILCDLSMPGWSGFDVLRELQADAVLKHSVVVAVTGYDDDTEKSRTAQAGFHAHIVKPLIPESLQEVIRRFLT